MHMYLTQWWIKKISKALFPGLIFSAPENMMSKFVTSVFLIRWEFLLITSLLSFCNTTHGAELLQTFEVQEGSPAGTVVGTIGNDDQGGNLIVGLRGRSNPPQPPYLIVHEVGFNEGRDGGGGGDDLIINEETGEIRTKRLLDREITPAYILNAIPLNGDNIKV